MTVLRRVASILLVLAAVAMLPVALGASWLERTVTDTDTYVRTVAPLADEPVFRESVRVRTEAAVLAALDPRGRAEELRTAIGGRTVRPYLRDNDVATAVTTVVELAVSEAVSRVIGSEAFPALWRDANRATHDSLMTALEAPAGAPTTIRIDLSGVVRAALDDLAEEGLSIAPGRDVDTAAFAVADSSELDEVRTIVQRIDAFGWWAPVLALLLVGAAIAISPLRRRTTMLAATLALPALGLVALGLLGMRALLDAAADPGEERDLVLTVWDVLVADLWRSVGLAAGLAVLAFLVALVAPRVWHTARGEDPQEIGTITPGA